MSVPQKVLKLCPLVEAVWGEVVVVLAREVARETATGLARPPAVAEDVVPDSDAAVVAATAADVVACSSDGDEHLPN